MHKITQVFGTRAVIEAINSGKTIEKVFLQRGIKNQLFTELEQLVNKEGIVISYVPVEKLNRLTKGNHQGAVANISPIAYYDLDELITQTFENGEVPLFIVLDQISDVRNFGAIIRTAECTGVHGIIVQKSGSAPVNGDTIKTSAGAVFNVPICKVDHIKDAIYILQASGVKTVAASEKSSGSIYEIKFNTPCAIILGAEGKGISSSVLKIVDERAQLPMLGDIASLNVSVACGAFLYEAVRQRL